MYTEEEAKGKRCQQLYDPRTGQRFQVCVGSVCMAWRWDGTDTLAEQAKRMGWAEGTMRKGYCGLAGKP
jgi:hypothetical protein